MRGNDIETNIRKTDKSKLSLHSIAKRNAEVEFVLLKEIKVDMDKINDLFYTDW